MKIHIYTGGFVQTNAYLIETAKGNILVDAPEGVAAWLTHYGKKISDVLLTHQHYDHVQGAAELQEAGARLHAFAPYSPTLTLETMLKNIGMPVNVAAYTVSEIFQMDKPLEIAGLTFALAHVPGHSTDSVTLYIASDGVLFSGDTLFAGSVGRTDLPGGSHQQLLTGIRELLLALPSETQLFPGHGPASTIGHEAGVNPFLKDT